MNFSDVNIKDNIPKIDIKGFFSELQKHAKAIDFKGFFSELIARAKDIELKNFIEQFAFAFLISCAYSIFFMIKDDRSIDLYMAVFIPLLVICAVIIFFSCLYKSSSVFTLLMIFLIQTGEALQIFMMPAGEDGSVKSTYKIIISIALGVIAFLFLFPIFRLLFSNPNAIRFGRIASLFAVGAACVFLFVAGSWINGAKAWVNILGMSFQVTEIIKFFALIYFSLCVADTSLTEKQKSLRSLAVLVMLIGYFAIISELGTLLIITLIYFVMRFIFIPHKLDVIREGIVLCLVGLIGFGASFVCYKLTEEKPIEDTSVVADAEGVVDEQPEAEGVADGQSDDADAARPKAHGALYGAIKRFGGVYSKVALRFKGILSKDSLTADDTYQIDKAKEAMCIAGWFGTGKGSLAFVPAIESDFVFVYLLIRLGFLGVMLVFIAYITMMLETVTGMVKMKNEAMRLISFSFIFAIVLQSIICIAMNLGIFPIVGLPLPFISEGGSAMMINIIMCMFIVFSLGREKVIIGVKE